MKKKLPIILNFEEILKNFEKYKSPDTEINNEKKKKVLNLLLSHKNVLDEISEAMLDFVQLQIQEDPKVLVSKSRDIKTGKEYIVARTSYPININKWKEIKIYLGRLIDFNGDTHSQKVLDLAFSKMITTLRRRKKEGNI